MIASLENVTKSYGASLVLSGVTARIEDNARIGLIGVNGAGKSTLLNMLYGDLEPDDGAISRSGNMRLGFLRQDGGLLTHSTISDEMRRVFDDLLGMEREMRDLEAQISVTDANDPDYNGLTACYANLQERFEIADGYLINVKIETVLNGMGFAGVDRQTPVDVLSGGERTRLALCKLLLEAPDLLIMDEPTNHLDFKTLLWLEDYLLTYKGALLIVSHDRYFLDKLCTSMWEAANHKINIYNGNYSRYVAQKEERDERVLKEYEMQQEEIADIKDFVARNIVRASTTARAKSRQKALDKMEIIERPKAPPKPAKIRFQYKREPVKDVLHVEDMSLSVGEGAEQKLLFDSLTLDLMRGEKIALIGANGVGKSSFLKAIQGMIPYDKGYIDWGGGVDVSYFEQGEAEMSSGKTALDELWDRFPREYEHTIRTVLGNVQLTGENVYKKVGQLSGGERAKLKFAQLMLSCGNMLIMDEPTNHLDLSAKEALDRALTEYTGTLLVVSHDRYLLNKFPTKIAEMHREGLRIYKGNYEAYRAQKEKETQADVASAQEKEVEKPRTGGYRTKKDRSEAVAQKKRLEELERGIEELEVGIWNLENEITAPEIAGDYLLLQEKCAELEQKRLDLEYAMEEWSTISE